jgi:hypothetical protein
MKFIFIFSLITLSACSSEVSNKEISKKVESKKNEEVANPIIKKAGSCLCAQIFLPVCGENGQTYSNACAANCAQVKYKAGACNEK